MQYLNSLHLAVYSRTYSPDVYSQKLIQNNQLAIVTVSKRLTSTTHLDSGQLQSHYQ